MQHAEITLIRAINNAVWRAFPDLRSTVVGEAVARSLGFRDRLACYDACCTGAVLGWSPGAGLDYLRERGELIDRGHWVEVLRQALP